MPLDVVAGQTAPIDYQLTADGAAFDLTGCTVTLLARTQAGATVTFTGTVALLDEDQGKVRFSPAANDLVESAVQYFVRFRIVRADSKIDFFPTGEREVWHVRA